MVIGLAGSLLLLLVACLAAATLITWLGPHVAHAFRRLFRRSRPK
jgi:hypothetical protein